MNPKPARPLLYDRHGQAADLGQPLAGFATFLIGGGASATSFRDQIPESHGRQCPWPGGRRFVAMNHHLAGSSPDFRVMVDPPEYYVPALENDLSIWLLPWLFRQQVPANQRALFFHTRLNGADPERFFRGRYLDWGDMPASVARPGCRSVMLAALRLIHHMGGRDVHLVGCDFPPTPYFARLNEQLEQLAPVLVFNGLRLVNHNPDSGLRAFDFAAGAA